MIRSKISFIAGYAPSAKILNSEIESRVNKKQQLLPKGLIERKFGIRERRFGKKDEQASDLAVGAALKILQKINRDKIECLLFASGSSDLIEPATANIVQSKLKLDCPAFDVKNACNSFTNALQVADSFIKSGTYCSILIVTGEKLSSIIKLDPENKEDLTKRLACLSMGDAGAAALIEKGDDDSGIYAQIFQTYGVHWHLCTVPGGGSMFPHDGSKVFFEGKTKELRDIFIKEKGNIYEDCLTKAGWNISEVDHFFMHHVSTSSFDLFANLLKADPKKFYSVIEKHGNMAAASIPFAMSEAEQKRGIKKGHKVMIMGMASGISISVQLLIW